jgi:UDP-N-acetylglucosamine 2-epimerase (non-hydrolysing)
VSAPLKLLHIVGARPNIPKLAPLLRAGAVEGLSQRVIHTGQHYDDALSAALFRDLGLPPPDVNLAVGSGTHAIQTARILERLDEVLERERPSWLVLYGDVNSTLAAALAGAKRGIRMAHVEAGVRSGDRGQPEEINRILTDRLADLLLAPTRQAVTHLRVEGEPEGEIAFVGNVMVDALVQSRERARATGARARLGVTSDTVIVTLHRPSNVDDGVRLARILRALAELSYRRPVLFPVHPRTRAAMERIRFDPGRIRFVEPLGYLDMIGAVEGAFAVVTDSGGLQAETSVLGIPCLTVRDRTEWPETVEVGTNVLVPEPEAIMQKLGDAPRSSALGRIEGWDGQASRRIVDALLTRG